MREDLSVEEKSELVKEAMKEPFIVAAVVAPILSSVVGLAHHLGMNYVEQYKQIIERIGGYSGLK